MNYETWRITFQTSECAAKATFKAWQQQQDLRTKLEQERDQLKELAMQLCDAVENNDDLPAIKYALKCGYLVNKLRQKAQEVD